MIVSWNWLKDYLALDVSVAEFEQRLMMAGLNHESTAEVGDDFAIDLEVTSNRPDCLGHLGVAREAAVLFEQALKVPDPQPPEDDTPVGELTSVRNDAPELCRRYTARVIRGVKIGPSPDWLAARLRTIGVAVINNVVDVTNYVMMECGQPLHAFDFNRLHGGKIIVRPSLPGEQFLAIDHRTYALQPGTCVIADSDRAVALGGVMGGSESEVSDATTDVLIESADFSPLAIRTTARQLGLHSPSSYRFERGVDPAGLDWASRRCCELILQTAGGQLAHGVIDTGPAPPARQPIVLRLAQLERILGIKIEPSVVRKILTALGNRELRADGDEIETVPPSWRADLTREIDLVEEVARIHGYDKIPEDVGVAMVASAQSADDRVLHRVRHVLTACGLDEAMTASVVDPATAAAFSPWTAAAPLETATPVLRGATCLRRSLVPSLLGVRRTNENLANERIELFEIAKVYLPQRQGLPREPRVLALASGGDFFETKGIVETLLAELDPAARLRVEDFDAPMFAPGHGVKLFIGDVLLGFLGAVSDAAKKQFDLRGPATVAELDVAQLVAATQRVRLHQPQSPYPAVERDLNIVLDEAVRWAQVEAVVRGEGGEQLESLAYRDTYRDTKRLGTGKKSVLLTILFRSHTGTLTREAVDQVCTRIVDRIGSELGGELRA